jgi:glucokinase
MLKLGKDILKVRDGSGEGIKVIIGAGTGLGKCIVDDRLHTPMASEAGNTDFPAQDEMELKLMNFIKKREGIHSVSYMDMISGQGLKRIYLFLRESGRFPVTKVTEEIEKSDDKPAMISKYRNEDELCRETFRLYTKFYARCAKNFALDCVATGGIYIAGGIASKNSDIFISDDFKKEFEKCSLQALHNIPIYVILNYDVGLYGACLST